MEIASNYILSVTPPSYSQGAEEARKDNQARVQIPMPKESQGSQAQSKMANEYGNTQGANSLLNAQAQGIMQANAALHQTQRQEIHDNKEKGQESREKDSDKDGKKTNFTRAQIQESFSNLVSKVANNNTQSETFKSSQSSYQAQSSNLNESSDVKKQKDDDRNFGAKIYSDIAKKNGQFGVIASTVAKRYNASFSPRSFGRNLNISV